MSAFLRLAAIAGLALLAGCGGGQEDGWFHGYVEGDFIYLAAPQAGYLATLDAARGTRVAPGQQVFALAADPERDAVAEADARAGAARDKVRNLRTPRRAPEIASLEARVRAARTGLELAQTQLDQQEALAKAKFVSQARLDEARAARDRAAAELEATRQELAVYRTTLGRRAEVEGAQAELAAAEAATAQRRWALERKTVAAPARGEINDTYYRPGEWVGAGQPVASLLPDDRRRLRFFVPEPIVGRLAPGQQVEARCDGCGAALRARIDFIASEAEYTPPVIYSEKARAKLVFRVEAVPAPADARRLRPGEPIDVRLVAASRDGAGR